MIQRVKQFFHAIRASVNEADKRFIKENLTVKEQKLFFTMRVYDQRHTLNVAYTALNLIKNKDLTLNKSLLIKVCLLHDIGRNAEHFCIWDKVINVLLNRFLPKLAKAMARDVFEAEKRKNQSNFNQNQESERSCNYVKLFWQQRKYSIYIYYNHAQIGADKLSAAGLEEVANIVRYHHDLPCKGDSEELNILRLADELN